jgi:hypothetical protein
MEDDGTSWSAPVVVQDAWSEPTIPIAKLVASRGVKLPQGFPGEWSYWVVPAEGRGGRGDRPRLERIERLQFALRRQDAGKVAPESYGVEVEWVRLEFAGADTGAR